MFAFWTPSTTELIVVLVLALLLFGKRLPEVARSLGKGIVEFKKGVKGIDDDVQRAEYEPPRHQSYNRSDASSGSVGRGEGEQSPPA